MPTNEKPVLAGPTRPLGSPDIPQFHLPAPSLVEGLPTGGKGSAPNRAEGPGPSRVEGVYTPYLYGAAQIQFADRKRGLEDKRAVAFLVPLEAAVRTVDWDAARPTKIEPGQLLTAPPVVAGYLPLSAGAMKTVTFTRWAKSFDRWLARTQRAEFTTSQDPSEKITIGPKRGGVSVDLVAIVWEFVPVVRV